jgi:hypothetical protein
MSPINSLIETPPSERNQQMHVIGGAVRQNQFGTIVFNDPVNVTEQIIFNLGRDQIGPIFG